MNQEPAAPADPSQNSPGLADLWPSLGLPGPPSPQLWAWALEQYGLQGGGRAGQGGTAPAQQDAGDAAAQNGTPDWPGATPANQVWADAVQNVGQTPPGGDASAAPLTTAMAAADAPDQDNASDEDASQVDPGPSAPPDLQGAAVPASSVAAPAAAQVPIDPSPSASQAPPPASAPNPGGQFLRPELSAGPDPLVAALAGDHPNDNPTYVTTKADAGCVVPDGFRLLHDAAAAGLPPAAEPAGKSVDAPSGVAIAAVADTVTQNYGICHETAERLKGWQDWWAEASAAR
jgi:hypothetical protein